MKWPMMTFQDLQNGELKKLVREMIKFPVNGLERQCSGDGISMKQRLLIPAEIGIGRADEFEDERGDGNTDIEAGEYW